MRSWRMEPQSSPKAVSDAPRQNDVVESGNCFGKTDDLELGVDLGLVMV